MASKKPSVSHVSTFASLPRTVRGRALVLSGDPKNKNFLYTNGNNVIVRDINHPEQSEIVTKHAKPVNVAKYSPTGFYIASGDDSGKIIIWDTTQKEHIDKSTFQPLGGAIKDLAWDAESKRIAVGGDGREKFAHVFTYDSGNSVGDLNGPAKSLNAIDIKPTRPYRLVTASEDYGMCFFEGPPFKFSRSIKEHKNFVNVVRYSPNGEVFISGSSDRRALVMDGKTGEIVGELCDPSSGEKVAHSGGVYALSFNGDGSKVVTCSGDKTAKIWDVKTQQIVSTFEMGKDTQDMQLGCLWQGDYILTVSLSGYINYLDQNNPQKLLRCIKGTNRPITCMALSSDKSRVYTGSSDSHINYMDVESFEDDDMKGNPHANQVNAAVIDGDKLITVGMDDTIKFSDTVNNTYGESAKLDSQPRGLDSKNGKTVVACINHVEVFEDGRKQFSRAVTYEPKQVAISPSGDVAVSGEKDNTIHICNISSGDLSEIKSIPFGQVAMDMEFSPDGRYLAVAGSLRTVCCYDVSDYSIVFESKAHSAKVNTVSWNPSSTMFATGSVDTNTVVWRAEKGTPNYDLVKGAHAQNQITAIKWINDDTFLTAGQDSCIKKWHVD